MNKIENNDELDMALENKIIEHRKEIEAILDGKDDRLIALVGPCSIHDYSEAIEYAKRLKEIEKKISKEVKVVMRTYFQKPRTVKGWEGFLMDPNLDGSYDLEKGISEAQRLLKEITELGLACCDEALNIGLHKKVGKYLSWCAVGARNSEDQNLRKYASGVKTPVGVKHPRDGCLDNGSNGVISISSPHRYFDEVEDKLIETKGNKYAHMILRGHKNGSNITREEIMNARIYLEKHGLKPDVVIDVSHDNCFTNNGKDYRLQVPNVKLGLKLMNEDKQIAESVKGFMVESNINPGNQKISENMEYGVSITDPCIDINDTESVLLNMKEYVNNKRKIISVSSPDVD